MPLGAVQNGGEGVTDMENVISDVISAFDDWENNRCCPGDDWSDVHHSRDMVIALLKAQELRVMTVSEIGALANGDVVWVEFTDGRLLPMMVEDGCLMRWRSLWRICEDAFYDEDYKARAWTSRPDQATREATPWN